MRETSRERGGSRLTRLPKIGAWSASAALVLASLAPLPATADETPEPEETVTTAETTDAETAEALADEDRKARVVTEVDPETTTASEDAPDPDESVEQPAEPDTPEVTEPSTEPTVSEAAEEPTADATQSSEAIPAQTSDPEVSETADESEAAQEDEPEDTQEDESGQDDELEFQQDDAEFETNVWLTPSSPVSQRELETGSNQVLGTGFPANTAVSVTIDGQTVATGETLANGGVNLRYNVFLEPGTYTVTVTADEVSDSTELVVTEGGYSMDVCVGESYECYFDELNEIIAWDLARTGSPFSVEGFRPNEVVTLSINGTTLREITVDDNGFAHGTFTAELTPGTYTLTATSSIGSASYDFVVIDDSNDWGDYDETPSVEVNRLYMTESWLQDNALIFDLDDYPSYTSVDVYLNGEYLETIEYQWRADYELSQDLAVGTHTFEFRHPVGNVSIDIAVHPDEQGDPVFSGDWAGNAEQTGAGSFDWSELDIDDQPQNHTYPLALHIDDAGNLTSLSGEFWWVCIGVETGYIGSGYSDLAASELPTTALTVDRPFDIEWEGAGFDYRLTGVLNADGTASGTLRASLGACGASTLNWDITFDGELPDPSPEPTPEPTPEPSDDPTPDPTDDPTQEPTPDPTDTPTSEPTASDAPSTPATYDPSTPAESTIPKETPDADELSEDEAQGVKVPSTARADETITVTVTGVDDGTEVGAWLFSEPVYLGTHTVTDSTIQVTVPADVSAGEHRIAVYSADGELIGWDTISISAASPGAAEGTETPATESQEGAPAGGPGSAGDTDTSDSGTTTGQSSTAEDSGSVLARSGASITLATIGGLALLGVGVLVLLRRRDA